MDFNWSEEQKSITDLAEEVLTASLDEQAFGEGGFAAKVWAELARTELLGVGTKAEFGGSDMGLMALLLLQRQAACHAAPLPILESLVMAAPLLQACGDAALKATWLAELAAGQRILALAVHEPGGSVFDGPRCAAHLDGDQWQINGEKTAVAFAAKAQGYIVLAATPAGMGLFLVEADSVVCETQRGTDDAPLAQLTFTASPAQLVSQDKAVIDAFERRLHLAFSTQLLGLSETALKLTAAYLRERKQFGVPIGSFQAVSQRVGDAFIALEAMRVGLWRAAWLESEGRPSAFAVASARYVTAKGAHQIVSAAQHLHGGMGFDRDYPLHRYFLGVKRIEFLEGGASAQLQRLGGLIAQGES
jgi:alkylation response protein AidB-like acyl-CoA dehydrogenase